MRLAALTLWVLLILPQAAWADKINVVCSFSILGDMTRQVAGDAADITILVGPDSDSHAYEPTPADARTIAQAQLIVINGLGFEGWMERLVKASGYKGPVIEATHGIVPLRLSGGMADPHAWQNPVNAKIYVTNIRDALILVDSANKAFYERNAAAYLEELAKLDAWVRLEIARVPEHKRKIITSHDAFGYLAEKYGIMFLAPQGASALSQPTATDVARLIDGIRARKVTALFMENITDPRMIEQIRKDSGATLGGTLYSDALSAENGSATTYAALVRHNITVLTEAMRRNPD